MKPKDLKSPFTWNERKPFIQGNILFVPEHYQKHEAFEMPSMKEIFLNENTVSIEYCSGNGEWIADKARANPDKNWIAVEIQFQRVRKIWSKSQNLGLKNLFIVCGEALTFTEHYLPKGCADEVYVNFPDPWPKNRHAKHRLIQEPFAKELARVSSQATFVTDDAPYADQMRSEMAAHWSLKSSKVIDESHGPSFFDRLWRSKGRNIQKLEFTCPSA